MHRRFVEHVLAANPGAAFRAACGYAIGKKLKSLKAPLTVLAPRACSADAMREACRAPLVIIPPLR